MPNRVFELDDLWTNTLGAYLAYLGFQYLQARLLAKKWGNVKSEHFQSLFEIFVDKVRSGSYNSFKTSEK